jgi:sulfur relay (sulfurtransferase) DsrF/TusC family protein
VGGQGGGRGGGAGRFFNHQGEGGRGAGGGRGGRGQQQQQQQEEEEEEEEGWTTRQMLEKGLQLAKFHLRRQQVRERTNVRRFRAFYGVGPAALACLWNDLQRNVPLIVEKTEGERIQQNPTKMTVKDFFLTMHFLKCYDVEEVMAGEWGYDEKTLRIKTRAYQRWIQVLAELKIVFGGFEGDEIFWCSVDGVHCMIFEPRKDPSSKWFSHKSNGAGLTYEVACAIRGNRCVWVRGPFPASQHDITTFRGGKVGEQPWDPAALINLIPEGKRAIADSGKFERIKSLLIEAY